LVTKQESKRALGRLLMAFVLVSIGYGLGMEVGEASALGLEPILELLRAA